MFLLSLNKRHIFRNICIFYTKLLVLVDNSDSYKIFASTRTLGISWEICNSVVHYVQQVLLIFNYLGCSETTEKKNSPILKFVFLFLLIFFQSRILLEIAGRIPTAGAVGSRAAGPGGRPDRHGGASSPESTQWAWSDTNQWDNQGAKPIPTSDNHVRFDTLLPKFDIRNISFSKLAVNFSRL